MLPGEVDILKEILLGEYGNLQSLTKLFDMAFKLLLVKQFE